VPTHCDPLIVVNAELRCRECGKTESRNLNLPVGTSPPKEFTCAVCNGEKSITDRMSDEELAKCRAPLSPGDVIRRWRAKWEARLEKSIQWGERHPDRLRAARLFRKGRWKFRGRTRKQRSAERQKLYRQFMANVEASGWKCSVCGRDLDDKKLCRIELRPVCRTCAGKQAIRQRWQSKKLAA
jgi:hypothetical protein